MPGALALILVTAARVAAARVHRVEVAGLSMQPTLEPGDRLLAVPSRRILPGDLVVVPDPRLGARSMVKRVVVVSGGSLTVRGDNPAASTDSRTFGPLARSAVRGRVVYRYFPAHRRGRIGRLVP